MEISDIKKLLTNEQIEEFDLWCEANKQYYTGETMMSDPQFDNLEETLLDYNIPELTEFIEKTIYDLKNGMTVVSEYTQEMISLKKEKYESKASISDCKKFFTNQNYSELKEAPKFDGAAGKISFDFTTKEIKSILSRGGLDITKFFKNHRDIVKCWKYNSPIVTGEFVINKKLFEEKYSDDWENARNFVGKLFKQKTISQEIIDDLDFVPTTNGCNPIGDYWSDFDDKKDWYNLESIIKHYKSEDFPYLCDGIVIAFDEPFIDGIPQRRIKDKYPLNMLAIKFQGERARTFVEGFEWTQKKSGKLTPKLVIKPVPLDGATMTRANAYNYGNLIKSHIGIGSQIEIEKSGDIIPVVKKVISYSNNIILPECEYIKSGKHLIAKNLEISRQYKFVLGLKKLQLDGIGEVLADKIGSVVDYQIINLFNPKYKADIYTILGGGSNFNKFNEIYNIKTLTLDKLINLLQFDNVGDVLSLKIANIILKKSTDTSNISVEVLRNVAGGEGFLRIKDAIEYLKIHGIKVIAPIEINADTITFEMSLDPPGMTKEEFIKQFKTIYPNSMHTGLTKTTTYLFTSDLTGNSGKINKARKYNVKVVSYSDALKGNLK